MPEIKHNFTKGRMNKDLDERLIPNGEYRDAMNIQVSTSEGSDVGTVQNILGNSEISSSFITGSAVCVGSIADEKNDKLYWFINDSETGSLIDIAASEFTGDNSGSEWTNITTDAWTFSNDEAVGGTVSGWMETSASGIIEGRRYRITYNLTTATTAGGQLVLANHTTNNSTLNSSDGNNNAYLIAGATANANINNEQVVDGSITGTYSVDWVQGSSNVGKIRLWNSSTFDGVIDNIIVQELNRDIIAEYDVKTGVVTPVFVDLTGEILKFDASRIITGINIIDGMLFWTDNYSEPKKINVQRSKDGTASSGFEHTKLINNAQKYNYNVPSDREINVKEDHTTVIKKSPKYPPTLEYETLRDPYKDYTGIIQISDHADYPNSFIESSIGEIYDFNFLRVGDYFKTIIEREVTGKESFVLDWKNWMPVVIKEFTDAEAPSIPISNYTIKGKITDWLGNNFSNIAEVLTKNSDFKNDASEWSGGGGSLGWTYNSTNSNMQVTFPSSGLGSSSGNVGGVRHDAFYQQQLNSSDEQVVLGKTYRVRWDVGPPVDGSDLQGRLWVTFHNNIPYEVPSTNSSNQATTYNGSKPSLFDQANYNAGNPNTFGNTYRTIHGDYSQPAAVGNYEEFVTIEDHSGYDDPTAATTANQTGPWKYWSWGTPTPFNSWSGSEVVFHIKNYGYTGDGIELVDDINVSLSHTHQGTLSSIGTSVSNVWQIPLNTNKLVFRGSNLTGSPNSTQYVYDITQQPLPEDTWFWVEIIISNYTGTGKFGVDEDVAFPIRSGLKLNANIPNATVVDTDYDSLLIDENTVSGAPAGEWGGDGGIITGYVKGPVAGTSSNGKKPDIRASKDCSATIEVSVQVREQKYFNGTIDNIIVEEIDSEQAQVEIRVDSINGIPPTVETGHAMNYAIDKFDEEARLFEEKLSRLAIRYKYEDGEYSAFSPFTEPVFIPGSFDYHPTKGYNLGMTNNLKSLKLKNLRRLIPEDVSSIDILYKEEHSPNIYIVDTIKDLINFDTNDYVINRETIKNGILPSNQLLRPWDNVPRKALAQDVVGNRIVYGNYLQNYNLISSFNRGDYNVNIDVDVVSNANPSRSGVKSIKSLREYQVGVVYTDKYGRETPVLTNPKATFKIDKANASEINQVEVGLINEGHPVNMKYFKFYIKDTGGEYYNLAMDRYYNAEDSNIWLAFPSVDRNKVDIDDFIILKKGSGNIINNENKWAIPNIVREKAQYKILDIKNEAPDFIKRKETLIASKIHLNAPSGTDNEIFASGDLPSENDINFSVNHFNINTHSYANLHEDFHKDSDVDYYISLSSPNTGRVSNRYKVIRLQADDNGTNDGNDDLWRFTLEKPFTNEVNSFTNDKTGENVTEILNNTYLNIYKVATDKSASHKFDGRFFVKIYNDDIFKRLLKEKHDDEKNKEYKPTGISRKIYSLETHDDSNRIKKHYDGTTTQAFFGIDDLNSNANLNTRVTDQPDHSEFKWNHYAEVTNNFAKYLGTLSGKLKRGNVITPSSLRDVNVWRDYDAYFRGINVYLGNDAIGDRVINSALDLNNTNSDYLQKFEDVWFIDKATNAGHFTYSTLGENGSGWDTWPEGWRPIHSKSVGITSNWQGHGILELGFGGIQPVEWSTDTSGWANDPNFYDLAGGNENYSERETDFIKQIAIGSQFRFKEDPTETIYTITDVNIFLRVRYERLSDYYPLNTNFHDGEQNDLQPNHLFPFHAKAVAGKATGFLSPQSQSTTPAHNIWGKIEGKGHGLESEVYPTDGSSTSSSGHTYATCTYLRPSNYTKNWKLTLDKSFTGKWNPAQVSVSSLTDAKHIQLVAPSAGTASTRDTVTTTSNGGGATDKTKLETGMVLVNYYDSSASATVTLSPPAIVTKITTDGTSVIKLKTYDGSTDFANDGAGSATPSGIGAGDTLNFYQYPMNGLSPNSVRNLNYFRNTIGNGTPSGGTTAIGYTLEWLEEKSYRSEEEILPKNPAIWETKPKENTDIDVYYEASGQIPIEIELNSENMLDFIPIGSTVEYENKPHIIPPGTTITDINTENEQIILSSNIRIVDTPWYQVNYVAPATNIN